MPSSSPPGERRVPHTEHCICRRCRSARRRQRTEDRRRPLERVWSDDVAEHIADLLERGWTQTEIAKAAGVSTGVVSKAKWPGLVLDVETAERIMAVR
jgi:hypothetical protein